MARDHDGAIRALRAEARRLVKSADGVVGKTFPKRATEERLIAAAFSLSADFLSGITGTLERAARRATKLSLDREHERWRKASKGMTRVPRGLR